MNITKLDQEQAAQLNDSGIRHYQSRDYKSAIWYFTQAIRLNPLFVSAFYNRFLARSDFSETLDASQLIYYPTLIFDFIRDFHKHTLLRNQNGISTLDNFAISPNSVPSQ